MEIGYRMFCLYVLLQILLESLPISSSSHVALLGMQVPRCVDFFAHGPTVLMLLIYFRDEIYTFFSLRGRSRWPMWLGYSVKIFVAELITVGCFVVFKQSYISLPLWCGLLITAILLFSLKIAPFFTLRRSLHTVRWSVVVLLGLTQGISLLPGISRLASTLVVARWAGIEEAVAFRFSCALQVPIFAAAGLWGLWDCWGCAPGTTLFTGWCLLGILIATTGAYYLLKVVERLYRQQQLWLVGFYMLVPIFCALFL